MRPRLVFVLIALCVMPAAAGAQDGLRSASLPERTPMNPIPPERRDLFLARPDTYRPSPGVPPTVVPGSFFYPSIYPQGGIPPVVIINVLPGSDTLREPANAARRDAVPESAPVVYTPGTPGPPKTFYVIPGCYAGDKPPTAESVSAGCDLRRVRRVPPVVTRAATP